MSNLCLQLGVLRLQSKCVLFTSQSDRRPLHFSHPFVVVNFDALAQASDIRIKRRQVVFLCWMYDSKLVSLKHLITSSLNVHLQTDWAIENQGINFNSTPRLYDERTFSPPDFTANWLSHLALAIYMFVVNVDALAQPSDFRIETLSMLPLSSPFLLHISKYISLLDMWDTFLCKQYYSTCHSTDVGIRKKATPACVSVSNMNKAIMKWWCISPKEQRA